MWGRMFNSIPGLYPLGTRSIAPLAVSTNLSLDIAKCPLGQWELLMLENCWPRSWNLFLVSKSFQRLWIQEDPALPLAMLGNPGPMLSPRHTSAFPSMKWE